MKVRTALISVSDKTGLDDFVKGISGLGIKILSTGGTAKKIASLGIKVTEVSDHTGFPEMLDGRVKTLHPKIHGGLLALRENAEHMETIKKHGIEPIDMVVVNLYPFEKTVANPDVKFQEAIENIDIGGPSMLRSAAKNFKSVAVICNPSKYAGVLEELQKNNGQLGEKTLSELAVEVFKTTSRYDGAIYDYLSATALKADEQSMFPKVFSIRVEKAQDLRYGENSHQKAAFYVNKTINESCVSNARQLHGKELSFNNILDLNAAIEIVKEFDAPASTIIKHTNPCGTAMADTLAEAYLEALDCDKMSAFGSIVGFNRKLDRDTAKAIIDSADFVECTIAPGYEKEALDMLMKKKNLRIMDIGPLSGSRDAGDLDMKKVVGGILVQQRDLHEAEKDALKAVTKKIPSQKQLDSLLFGMKIAKHVRSNAIVLCQGTKTVGVGAGQMSRVDSVIIASRKAQDRSKGSTMASDAFFPKEDAIEMAQKAGISAIIQPGGSIRDKEVIDACNKSGIAMVITGIRHFKH